MKLRIGLAALAFATTAAAATPEALHRVYEDAAVIDRVAEISRRDLPADLLKRLVEEDIDLLRGKRADGSYEHATYERLEASRTSSSHSVQPRKNDEMKPIEAGGSWVYRMIVSSPTRRMVMTKNRRVFIERVELDYIPEGSPDTRKQTIPIREWLEPGQLRAIDFPEVARQATARLFARADSDAGYGNVVVALVRARIVDNADSPYADAVASAKAIERAIEAREVPSIRAMAARIRASLAPEVRGGGGPATRTIDVVAPNALAFNAELQVIEDLLTGDEAEKQQGMDRLHDLVRKTRPIQ